PGQRELSAVRGQRQARQPEGRAALRGAARGPPQGLGGASVTAPRELLDRIHLRLEESFVGISEVVGDLAPADLAELLNDLTLVEAATVITMLPTPRAVEAMDQPTLRRRAAILSRIDPGRATPIQIG